MGALRWMDVGSAELIGLSGENSWLALPNLEVESQCLGKGLDNEALEAEETA